MKRWIPWMLLSGVTVLALALWGRSAPGSAALGLSSAAFLTLLAQVLFARTLSGSWRSFGLAFLAVFSAQAAAFAALALAAGKTPLAALPTLASYGAGVMLATMGLALSFPAAPRRGRT